MNEKRIYWNAIYELLKGRRVGKGRAGVAISGECWVFLGALDACGYGSINRGDFVGRAHRYVWLKLVGPIAPGLQVLHRCDNPRCVRPSHLWLGTQTENIRDMFAKGRGNIDGLRLGTHASAAKRRDAGRTLATARRKEG